jgi:diguanylate cyclase (GGDEF)-like protein/PAS domain S-box-containing protein
MSFQEAHPVVIAAEKRIFVPGRAQLASLARKPLFLAYAIGPVTVALFWLFRDMHDIADHPMWVYGLTWIIPAALATAATVLDAKHPSKWTLHARAATGSLATTVIIYATGWGPAVDVVYLVAAQQLVAEKGAATWRICRLWAFTGIAGGQIAVAVGIAPSYIRTPLDNGIAALGALAFLYVSRMAETISADRERAWEAARVSGERFASLVQNSSDMILVLDEVGTAIYAGGACERLLGIPAQDLHKADLRSLVHPDDIEPVRNYLSEALLLSGPTQPVEMRVRSFDGTWRHVEAVGTNQRANPSIGGVVLNVRDVTDRKRAEAELAHNAMHDGLTGLPNRALLLKRLSDSLARLHPESEQPALLFLDVDRFKLINDSLGHDVGDQLLVEAARRLRSALRAGDTVARFGGDEFVILCEPPGDPVAVAGRVLATFEKPFRLAGEDFYLTASVGVAAPEDLGSNPAELIRDADTAMYRAKELGRGRVQVFDEEARASALARVHTEHLLRGAVDRGELRLFYQPIVDLQTGQLVATEALLRWQHPHEGLVGPARFIDVAEDSGLVVMLGDWVLRQACDQAERWAASGSPVNMAVNISAGQLADEDFARTVEEMLLRPLHLTLELTESVLIREPQAAAERISKLKGLGVFLAMDDFGTGYSSLANLRRYPFDKLKIDQRFVAGLTESSEDEAIIKAIIGLAHELGRIVIAEGVETWEQLTVLRALGCDRAQGFHLGKPQPAPDDPSKLLNCTVIHEPAVI